MSNTNVRDWPVIETLADAEAHNAELPALVPVPGHLVRPITILVDQLYTLELRTETASRTGN